MGLAQMTEPLPDFLRLDCGAVSLVIQITDASARLVYFGSRLNPDEDMSALAVSLARSVRPSQPDRLVPASLLPQDGSGYPGLPAFELRQNYGALDEPFRLASAKQTETGIALTYVSASGDHTVRQILSGRPSGVIRASAHFENRGAEEIEIVRLASLCLPLPAWAKTAHVFPGRWAGEMQEQALQVRLGRMQIESRGGRPGFAGAHWALFTGSGSGHNKPALGVHLAWSGDARLTIEHNSDDEQILMLEPRLDTREILLGPGEAYETPETLFVVSPEGRDGVRQAFHQELLAEPAQQRRPRKVHINTWEAVGFDLSESRLFALAAAASALGAERFVLDDGWFTGRRNDRTSLGDWEVDRSILPGGLAGLADHVGTLSMDLGLWVEPEMVSPESQLYREHPDWCLHIPGHERPTQRNQLVLDLTLEPVREHLFGCLCRLLDSAPVAYLKWDHNRELFPRAGRAYRQTLAFYGLLDSLLARYPTLDIETCASGGGRVDFAVLRRCHRFWASDNNDAIDRLGINKSWLQFLPLAALGSHVGPSPNPITGRRLSMNFRARTAMFGHMGIEADPQTMTPDELSELKAHIALYKSWRDTLHDGVMRDIPHNTPNVTGWIVNNDKRALALVTQSGSAGTYHIDPVCLPGLDPDRMYRVTLPLPWPEPSARFLANKRAWRDGFALSGKALGQAGLALPLSHPETAWLVALESE